MQAANAPPSRRQSTAIVPGQLSVAVKLNAIVTRLVAAGGVLTVKTGAVSSATVHVRVTGSLRFSLSERSRKRGIVRPEALDRYVREHTTGERDHAFQLWTLLMLELWFQRFIDPQ